MAKIQFNANNVAPAQAYEPLPADWYAVQIVGSDRVLTKAGTGSILKLQQKVLEGKYAGRVIFCNLNIENPNSVAQDIAQQQLSAICHATGVIQCEDSEELHGKPYMVRVTVREPQNGYDASNDCKAFKAIQGAAPAPVSQAAPVAAPVAAEGTPPWAK